MTNLLQKFNAVLTEGISQEDLAYILYDRLDRRYPDIVTRYGHEVVGDAINDVASFHAGAEELGSSDISIMIKQILRNLENYGKDIDETKGLPFPGTYEQENNMFKTSGPRRIVAMTNEEQCPHCGGEMVSEELMNEKKDACYYKVKSRYKVWPSAYASGALVKCRKKGASNWGTGGKSNESVAEDQLDEKWSKKYKDSINCSNPKGFSQKAHCAGKKKNESSILEGIEQVDENLHQWFKEKWVRFGPDGKIRGDCARGDDSEGKPKCLPQSKAHSLGKKGRASAAARKRREDPNPERRGPAKNVATKKKNNEGVAEGSDKYGFHTSVSKGKFLPSKYGQDENNLYLHDLMNVSGDGSGPQLVTIDDKRIATELAAMYGGYVERTGMGTYRVYQPRGARLTTKKPEQQGVAEAELDEACWKGYHKEGNKKMFGKTYPNCVKNKK